MTKILIVDDHAVNRELVVALIEHRGHQPLEAADGAEALALVRAHKPQLVICDILMPTMDGYEFVRKLRQDADIAGTEVIFYTANYHEREARHLASAVGVSQVLIKPCIPEDILRAIDMALTRDPAFLPAPIAQEFEREHLRLVTDKLAKKADDLKNANLRLSALTDLNLNLASERDPHVLLDKVCHGARELLGAKYAFVCIKAKNNGQAIYHFSSGLPPAQADRLECPQIDEGLFGAVMAQSKPLRFFTANGSPQAIGLPASYPQVHSTLIAPIVSLRLVYGWICLVDKVGAEEFDDADEHLLAVHAAQVGRVYENGSLYVQIERRAAELANEVAERKMAEEKVHRLNRVYMMLSGINGLIVRTRDTDELYRESCKIAVESGGFLGAFIAMGNPETRKMRLAASTFTDAGYIQRLETAIGEVLNNPSEWFRDKRHVLFDRGLPVVVNNVENEVPVHFRSDIRAIGANSQAVLPLVLGKQVVGIFGIRAREIDFFDKPEMDLLLELTRNISFALDHIHKSDKLNYLAYHDELTGLANRTLFFDRLAQVLETARRDKHMAAAVVLNIDRFKTINDTLGRHGGDELLKQMVSRFGKDIKDRFSCARMNADTFAIVLPELMSVDNVARDIESSLKQLFGKPFLIGDTELRIAAKVGIALFPNDGADPETLFKNAEAALKKAKARGSRYLFYTQQMSERVEGRLRMENRLRVAVEREQFVLHYQPKVSLPDRRLVGVEALIRWNDPATELLAAPMEFIPLLEETGLIQEVGTWALHRAIQDQAKWRSLGLVSPRIAVNVSPIQLRLSDFVTVVKEAMGTSSAEIDLEITENVIMEDIENTIGKLRVIRDMGINISVDDFGTGYSSLAYLARLPVSEIKIDRSFIVTMLRDDNTRTLVLAIIAMAHSLGLSVVAEGVENEDQARELQSFGCDQMQGYLYSKPLPFEALMALLESAP